MELRPYQTALLAGRAASRWATSTSLPSTATGLQIPAFAIRRHLSSSRSLLQEAEAPAPPPPSHNIASMASYMEEQKQLQQQQASDANRRGPLVRRDIFRSSANSVPATRPRDSPRNLLQPWTSHHSDTGLVPRSPSSIQSIVDSDMNDLGVNRYHAPTVDDFASSRRAMGYERPLDVKYRLRPVVGRTINLQNGIDVARGLNILNMKCKVNKVSHDAIRQRFHERPGLKKKRLRSERWMRRFKQGFKATCSRVRELARQGW